MIGSSYEVRSTSRFGLIHSIFSLLEGHIKWYKRNFDQEKENLHSKILYFLIRILTMRVKKLLDYKWKLETEYNLTIELFMQKWIYS